MFCGLILRNGKKEEFTVEKSFHVSMASLVGNQYVGGYVPVFISCVGDSGWQRSFNNQPQFLPFSNGSQSGKPASNEYQVCQLNRETSRDIPLDLNFQEGKKVSFRVGNCLRDDECVHLTGYFIDKPNL